MSGSVSNVSRTKQPLGLNNQKEMFPSRRSLAENQLLEK